MAVTTEYSAEYTKLNANTIMDPGEGGGKIEWIPFNFTQGAAAGDATSLAYLCKLPPGKVRVIGALSRIQFSAFGASRVLDVGHAAYNEPDGDAVAADLDDLDNDIDVSSAGAAALGSALTGTTVKLFESRDGVPIVAQVAGGTIPVGATLKGWLAAVVS